MSPQIATVRPSKRPKWRRMVRASSSACVGCSCWPSPALITAQDTFCDSNSTAPDDWCRTTRKSGCMALMVIAVSSSVSPLDTDDVAIAMFITSAPRRLPAISKLRLGSRGVLEEQVHLCSAPARAPPLPSSLATFGIVLGEVEHGGDVDGGKVCDGQQMLGLEQGGPWIRRCH